MMEHYVLDEHGEPHLETDLLTWARWFDRSSRDGTRILAQDRDEDLLISTVFLGLDHGFPPEDSLPVLWETMIFGGQHHEYQERYTSRDDALAGHRRACSRVKLRQI